MQGFTNTGQVVDLNTSEPDEKPADSHDKKLVGFVIEHTDAWREYRDQNHLDEWLQYERIWRGKWAAEDKGRESERSKMISPATQQAIETRHAEIAEAIFGQGEFFDIQDDMNDKNGPLDVERLKRQMSEDFKQDKVRKAIEDIILLGEIYGTGIGEVIVSKVKHYVPATVPMDSTQAAYGVMEKDRISVKLVPVNPKNFLFDPNGTSVDDCMGVAVEKHVSIHKVVADIEAGVYRDVDISSLYEDDSLEPTQESKNFEGQKVKLLTYYGLVPAKCLREPGVEYVNPNDIDAETDDKVEKEDDYEFSSTDGEDYEDLVEAIVVIANGDVLLKAVETPYMMKDRPILTYQADSVPNRLLGRGTAEKAANMQRAIDGSMRSHMDALALTVAPMVGLDASRLPRGAKFEVKPGKHFLTNGSPAEIIFPFKFGSSDGSAMETSREFERMLLMATSTIDSSTIAGAARDGQDMNPAVAAMLKKYKRVLVNFQEDFLIPFIYKAAWRFMQYDPERYPAKDVKFIPTSALGIVARDYEQKQLAFLIQTLGAQSPLTPILMQSIVKNSGLSNRDELLAQLVKASQPDPSAQQAQDAQAQAAQADMAVKMAQAENLKAQTQLTLVKAEIAPSEVQARVVAALSNNLNEDNEGADFERRAKIAELMLKEKDIDSNHEIARMQMAVKGRESLLKAPPPIEEQ